MLFCLFVDLNWIIEMEEGKFMVKGKIRDNYTKERKQNEKEI